MTRLARVRNTDACHGEEVYVRYASPLFLLSSLPVGHQTVSTGCDLNAPAPNNIRTTSRLFFGTKMRNLYWHRINSRKLSNSPSFVPHEAGIGMQGPRLCSADEDSAISSPKIF